MKLICLGNGRFTKVDDRDFHWLSQTKWYYNKRGYVVGDMDDKWWWFLKGRT